MKKIGIILCIIFLAFILYCCRSDQQQRKANKYNVREVYSQSQQGLRTLDLYCWPTDSDLLETQIYLTGEGSALRTVLIGFKKIHGDSIGWIKIVRVDDGYVIRIPVGDALLDRKDQNQVNRIFLSAENVFLMKFEGQDVTVQIKALAELAGSHRLPDFVYMK